MLLHENEFKKHIDAPDLSQKNINKLYATLRNKIKKLINYGVKNLQEPLGYHNEGEITLIEIDESKE